jgi:hypothetical protein
MSRYVVRFARSSVGTATLAIDPRFKYPDCMVVSQIQCKMTLGWTLVAAGHSVVYVARNTSVLAAFRTEDWTSVSPEFTCDSLRTVKESV